MTVPLQHLLGVWHESDGQTELAQFRFDPTVPGSTRVTSSPATPPYTEFAFGEARADVQGQRETSVVMEGLVGGAATDRLQADPMNPYRIREIVQVVEEDGFGWVIGTDGDSCLRLRSNIDEGTVTIVVTAPATSDSSPAPTLMTCGGWLHEVDGELVCDQLPDTRSQHPPP